MLSDPELYFRNTPAILDAQPPAGGHRIRLWHALQLNAQKMYGALDKTEARHMEACYLC